MNAKIKAMIASYARSVLSAAIALYLAGVTDPVQLLSALAAGLLPVALRYLNPKDPAFGRVSDEVKEVILARLPDGEALIPKEYIERNEKAIQNIVKAYADLNNEKRAATKPRKTTPKK